MALMSSDGIFGHYLHPIFIQNSVLESGPCPQEKKPAQFGSVNREKNMTMDYVRKVSHHLRLIVDNNSDRNNLHSDGNASFNVLITFLR
jgi:hypothetical protein